MARARYTKDDRLILTPNEKRRALARFGLMVIKAMEADKDWGSDLLGEIEMQADLQGLTGVDKDGYFAVDDRFRNLTFNSINRKDT